MSNLVSLRSVEIALATSCQDLATEAIRKFSNENLYRLFLEVEDELLISARDELSKRLRKDTAVTLHLSGRDNSVKVFSSIFSNTSSTLSRLLTFLLYRSGGLSMSFADLDTCVQNRSVPEGKVLCRHGTDILGHLRAIISIMPILRYDLGR